MNRPERRARFRAIFDRVQSGSGVLPTDVRLALAQGNPPQPLAPLVEKITHSAAGIEDADITAALQQHSDDMLFEATVITALRASNLRLSAALRALGRE